MNPNNTQELTYEQRRDAERWEEWEERLMEWELTKPEREDIIEPPPLSPSPHGEVVTLWLMMLLGCIGVWCVIAWVLWSLLSR